MRNVNSIDFSSRGVIFKGTRKLLWTSQNKRKPGKSNEQTNKHIHRCLSACQDKKTKEVCYKKKEEKRGKKNETLGIRRERKKDSDETTFYLGDLAGKSEPLVAVFNECVRACACVCDFRMGVSCIALKVDFALPLRWCMVVIDFVFVVVLWFFFFFKGSLIWFFFRSASFVWRHPVWKKTRLSLLFQLYKENFSLDVFIYLGNFFH